MKIQFLGGAATVTGSQHLLAVNGVKVLLECGLFQGRRSDTYEKNLNFRFDPAGVKALLLSHAHIDHSGNIPNLVKRGFEGPIYATRATVDLCQIMLKDSAHIQQKDVDWVNKIRKRRHEPPTHPLYTMEDAEASLKLFKGVDYGTSLKVGPGVTATFRDAGHILGSAGILLEAVENGTRKRVGFTGDLGRKDVPVIRDPDYLRDLDFLIMESTYGNRFHPPAGDVEEELAQLIRNVSQKGGKIIIPAFAVGRTQVLVYLLHKLFDQNRIPDMPIFVDSPLAVNATEVFRRNPDYLDREAHRVFLAENSDPFGFSRLRYIRDVKDSIALNHLDYPHIVISASGMAEAGRILHHLKNNIENPRNLILIVGYAAQETLARKLMDGHKRVRIFGEEYRVRSQVVRMDHFSAHADKRGLLDFISTQSPAKLKKIFLVHGEEDQALPLGDTLLKKGFDSVHFPKAGDAFELE